MDMAFIPGTAELPLVRSSFVEKTFDWWCELLPLYAELPWGKVVSGQVCDWGAISYVWELSLWGGSAERSLGQSLQWGTRWDRDLPPIRTRGRRQRRRKRQVGKREMSGYLATREEPRAFGELRSRRLRTWGPTLEDGPPLLCLPTPPADTIPQGSLWGS